jgi:hypothetical protein
VRVLNVADILVLGAGARPLVDVHARRDAEHWTWAPKIEEAIADQARAGRLIAVVDEVFARPAARRLGAAGVAVERLEAAPGP